MIDFHNHVLPGVDDGSQRLAISIEMLFNASNQGITDVVNTVHFQHPKVEDKNISFDLIEQKTKLLQKILNDKNINVTIHIGSEVFFSHNLCDLLDNPIATIGNGKYMLIEFPIINFPIGYEDILFNLNLKGVTPIIAHPERYRNSVGFE